MKIIGLYNQLAHERGMTPQAVRPQIHLLLDGDSNRRDRANPCGGLMKPIGLIWNSRKGYQIRYRCEKCGREHVNKVAQDMDMPDDWEQVIKLLRNREV